MRIGPPWFLLVAPGLGALAGLLYGTLFDVGPLTGAAIRGAIIGTPILLYERRLLAPRLRDRIRALATPLFLIATVALYIGLIVIGNAVASTVLNKLFRFMYSARNAMLMTDTGLLYALGISALVVFVFRVRDLIGPGVFANLLIGRYHRPISEERIFLFLDVTGSTHFADRYGDREAQAYLGQVFNALALPVSRARGSIDDYIGDLALVTGRWTGGCAMRPACAASSTSRRVWPRRPQAGAAASAKSRNSAPPCIAARWSPPRSGWSGTRSRISATS